MRATAHHQTTVVRTIVIVFILYTLFQLSFFFILVQQTWCHLVKTIGSSPEPTSHTHKEGAWFCICLWRAFWPLIFGWRAQYWRGAGHELIIDKTATVLICHPLSVYSAWYLMAVNHLVSHLLDLLHVSLCIHNIWETCFGINFADWPWQVSLLLLLKVAL